MFQGLWALLRSLPSLISIGMALLQFIRDRVEAAERAKLTKEIKEALQEAVKTKDTTKLEDILRGNR